MDDDSRRRREGCLARYIECFQSPGHELQRLDRLVAEDVRFIDPFNEIVGRERLGDLLADFARQVESPSFEIQRQAWDERVCFVRWRLRGRVALIGDWCVDGVSEIHFDADNRVSLHLDHWDAASQFYRHLPLLGRLLGWLRRRIAA